MTKVLDHNHLEKSSCGVLSCLARLEQGLGNGRLGRRLVVTWGGIVRRQSRERPPNLWDCEGPTTQEEAGEEDEGRAAPRLGAQVEETVKLAPQTRSYPL